MFEASTYTSRRNRLIQELGSGVALFLGNDESPMNYRDNAYPFRQDSTFLYYWGLARQGLAALLDLDEGRAILFGDDLLVEDIVWTGPQPSLQELGSAVGVAHARGAADLEAAIRQAIAQGRRVHFLPQYRAETINNLEALVGLRSGAAEGHASIPFARAVIAQRSLKEAGEIAEIEAALEVSYAMHTYAMRAAKPGCYEREVAGRVEGIAIAGGGRLAFPCIFSSRGEVLHNYTYGNKLRSGDLVVNDSGASSPMGYASDITRTIPVGGAFSERQRAIYQCVLDALLQAIDAMKPGVRFKDIHLVAARSIASDLKELGLMKGDVDEAVAHGAHALFFPHGLGHMLGLDVHDLEGLGEDRVGYDESTARETQFGINYLRLGKELHSGFVLTVEPGCYFIDPLIEQWRAERRGADFINYDAVADWRGFGGVRIEDDVLITASGCRILGRPIPKTIKEVEAASAA